MSGPDVPRIIFESVCCKVPSPVLCDEIMLMDGERMRHTVVRCVSCKKRSPTWEAAGPGVADC